MLARRFARCAWLVALASCQVYRSSLLGSSAGASPTGEPGADEPPAAGGSAAARGGLGSAGDGERAGAGGRAAASPQQAGEGGVIQDSDGGAAGTPAALLSLIDDMEDADAFILRDEGRVGAWYAFADPASAAKVTIEPGCERSDSRYCVHLSSDGFTDYGGTGFALNSNGTPRAYDASQYQGIQLWLRVDGGSIDALHLAISDRSTHPAGLECDAEVSSGPEACFDDWLAPLVGLTEDWQRFAISFADFRQQGWGKQGGTAMDLSTLFEVQLQLGLGGKVSLWVDDVALIPD